MVEVGGRRARGSEVKSSKLRVDIFSRFLLTCGLGLGGLVEDVGHGSRSGTSNRKMRTPCRAREAVLFFFVYKFRNEGETETDRVSGVCPAALGRRSLLDGRSVATEWGPHHKELERAQGRWVGCEGRRHGVCTASLMATSSRNKRREKDEEREGAGADRERG